MAKRKRNRKIKRKAEPNKVAPMWYVFWPVAPLVAMAVGYLQVHLAGLHIESLQETQATIIETGTEVRGEYDSNDSYKQVYVPSVRFSYTALDKYYDTGEYTFLPSSGSYRTRGQAQRAVSMYQVGKSYPAWFDPDQPERAALHRGTKWQHGEMLYWSCIVFVFLPIVEYKSILRWFEPKEPEEGDLKK